MYHAITEPPSSSCFLTRLRGVAGGGAGGGGEGGGAWAGVVGDVGDSVLPCGLVPDYLLAKSRLEIVVHESCFMSASCLTYVRSRHRDSTHSSSSKQRLV